MSLYDQVRHGRNSNDFWKLDYGCSKFAWEVPEVPTRTVQWNPYIRVTHSHVIQFSIIGQNSELFACLFGYFHTNCWGLSKKLFHLRNTNTFYTTQGNVFTCYTFSYGQICKSSKKQPGTAHMFETYPLQVILIWFAMSVYLAAWLVGAYDNSLNMNTWILIHIVG